jgi:hypothetical protein
MVHPFAIQGILVMKSLRELLSHKAVESKRRTVGDTMYIVKHRIHNENVYKKIYCLDLFFYSMRTLVIQNLE